VNLIYVLAGAFSLLAASALWAVWVRDREQAFARDVAMWYVSTAAVIFCYPLWRNTNAGSILQIVAFVGIVGGFALGHTFLFIGLRRFTANNVPSYRVAYQSAGALFVIYGLVFWWASDGVRSLGALSMVVVTLAGVYATKKLWSRGAIERSIGFLIAASALVNVMIAIWGTSVMPLAAGLAAIFRTATALAFVFAALNRSTIKTEQVLTQFEELSENAMQGIIVLDERRFYYINPAAVAMFGYSTKQEMLATDPWCSTLACEREEAKSLFRNSMQQSHAISEMVTTRVRKDGSHAMMRFSGWRVDWDGHPAMQVLVSDETEKRRVSKALQIAKEQRIRAEEEHRLSLIQVNAELEQRVAKRTQDLIQSNGQLADANVRMECALESLRATQAELVQREKLASLGRMVAGIAHELNTPIGTALTIGTTIRHQIRQLQNDMQSGQMKKSKLNEFLAVNAEGVDVLENSLHKAHALITNFRQVSNDHTDEPLLTFNLSALLTSLHTALHPTYEGTSISLVIALKPEIQIQSYPGQITQIVTQLIDNARTHAFNGLENGQIRLAMDVDGHNVRISVSDNGHGIAPDIRDKVFDPFFSTKMGVSVGLGLNWVFTLVTAKLGGSVQLEAVQPHGASFVLRLPLSVNLSDTNKTLQQDIA
jgi:PAS domain S-box-containing protein